MKRQYCIITISLFYVMEYTPCNGYKYMINLICIEIQTVQEYLCNSKMMKLRVAGYASCGYFKTAAKALQGLSGKD